MLFCFLCAALSYFLFVCFPASVCLCALCVCFRWFLALCSGYLDIVCSWIWILPRGLSLPHVTSRETSVFINSSSPASLCSPVASVHLVLGVTLDLSCGQASGWWLGARKWIVNESPHKGRSTNVWEVNTRKLSIITSPELWMLKSWKTQLRRFSAFSF